MLPDGAASIWSVATRLTVLDQYGAIASGAPVFVTNRAVKATFAPVLETGADIVVRNANDDLVVFAKAGDKPKRYSMQLEFATPDPGIEQAVAGGDLLSDSSTALGAPSGLTATAQTTLGHLAAGPKGYRATQYNQYGESVAEVEVDVTTTGSTSVVTLSGFTFAAGALGIQIYGRTPGQTQQMAGVVPNITTEATNAASGTGAVASLVVVGLTQPIPQGFKFQIAGDTNTRKITFTTTAEAGVGAESISVSPSESVTTTIAAGAIEPVYVDDGTVVPSGALPLVDTTAGPGPYTGYQAPPLGIVGNPNGVSVEVFQKAIIGGSWSRYLPYYRWVFPMCKNMHQTSRELANANTASVYEGDMFENPNWAAGPDGDWQFPSSRIFAVARCGQDILPVASLSPVGALD